MPYPAPPAKPRRVPKCSFFFSTWNHTIRDHAIRDTDRTWGSVCHGR